MLWPRCCLVFVVSAVLNTAVADDKAPAPAEKRGANLDQEALEKAFAEQLSGTVLLGSYTIDGRNARKPPKPERYEIVKVSKLRDDYWVFNARLKYGEIDATIPITLKVLWAGDTPVISLTDLTIPGLGTFTARVLFYGERYVGTWQHGKVGGHMFGTLEKAEPSGDDQPASGD